MDVSSQFRQQAVMIAAAVVIGLMLMVVGAIGTMAWYESGGGRAAAGVSGDPGGRVQRVHDLIGWRGAESSVGEAERDLLVTLIWAAVSRWIWAEQDAAARAGEQVGVGWQSRPQMQEDGSAAVYVRVFGGRFGPYDGAYQCVRLTVREGRVVEAEHVPAADISDAIKAGDWYQEWYAAHRPQQVLIGPSIWALEDGEVATLSRRETVWSDSVRERWLTTGAEDASFAFAIERAVSTWLEQMAEDPDTPAGFRVVSRVGVERMNTDAGTIKLLCDHAGEDAPWLVTLAVVNGSPRYYAALPLNRASAKSGQHDR